MSNLWVDKYRRKSLEEVILPKKYEKNFTQYIEDSEFPSLLFHGGPGSGKSTVARILCDTISKNEEDVLTLNGSIDNGVDIIRDLITDFLISPSFSGEKKIVYFDEADYLTHNAQAALRHLMDKYINNGRFIFTCNYIAKISTAIQSRCVNFEFKSLQLDELKKYLEYILQTEGISYSEDILNDIIKGHYPDVRRILGILQTQSQSGQLSNEEESIERKILKLSSDFIINKLKSNDIPSIIQSMKDIESTVNENYIDFTIVYKKLFDFNLIPFWAKIIINEYTDNNFSCMIPQMNYLSCLYKIHQTYKALNNSNKKEI